MKSKISIPEIKKSYNRLKQGKTGLRLKLLNNVCLELYQAAQNAKDN